MARKPFWRRITDALGITRKQPEPEPEPEPEEPPQPPKRKPPKKKPVKDEDYWYRQAQAVWDDVAADVANNVDMEEPFVKFVGSRLEAWSNDKVMPRKEVRALITWLIVNSNVFVTHEDITAILERIYEVIYANV